MIVSTQKRTSPLLGGSNTPKEEGDGEKKRRVDLQIALSQQDKHHMWLTLPSTGSMVKRDSRRGWVRWGDEGWRGAAVELRVVVAEDEGRSVAPLGVLALHLAWEI